MSNFKFGENCSTKFWNQVLQADLGNIYDYQIQEEEKKDPTESQLTLKYLVSREITNNYGDISSQLEACQDFNKPMILKQDETPIVDFKEELKEELNTFNAQIMEEYDLMKEYFTSDVVTKIKERKKYEEIDIQNVAENVSEVALYKDSLKVETVENERTLAILHKGRPNRKLNQFVFYALKKRYDRKMYLEWVEAKIRQKRNEKILRPIFDAWRVDAHASYKEKVDQDEPSFLEQRREEVITEWDEYTENLKNYIIKLQEEIKVEVNSKAELVQVYEQVMNGSIKKFHEENNFVETQVDQYRQDANYDTFGRANENDRLNTGFKTIYNISHKFKSTDVQRVDLCDGGQPDSEGFDDNQYPEDEE